MSVNHYSYYWGVFNDSTVRRFIEKDVPVELFCSIQDLNNPDRNVMHAVVAYGYQRQTDLFLDKTDYYVHYGWKLPAAALVNIAAIGSMYCFQ